APPVRPGREDHPQGLRPRPPLPHHQRLSRYAHRSRRHGEDRQQGAGVTLTLWQDRATRAILSRLRGRGTAVRRWRGAQRALRPTYGPCRGLVIRSRTARGDRTACSASVALPSTRLRLVPLPRKRERTARVATAAQPTP